MISLTLCCESSARDTVADLTKTGVGIEHFSWCCLQIRSQSEQYKNKTKATHLGVIIALEQMSRSNKTDIVVPHDGPSLVDVGNLERVLEDFSTH